MTPILRSPIDHPMAWRGQDFAGKETVAFDLGRRQVEALEELLGRIEAAGTDLAGITAADCRHPALDAPLERLFQEIQHGRGIAIVRGFPVERHSVEQIGKMFWAFGTHLGIGLSQSALGDRLGYVRDETPPGQPQSARGYISRRELSLHNDLAHIVGLMCVRQGKGGGLSQYASGLAIHNAVLAERPDLLEVYYEGFPYHRRGEQPADQPEITPYNVPVFSQVDGQVSVFFVPEVAAVALRDQGRDFTPQQIDAIDFYRTTAKRLQFETRLEPGEASILNNLTVHHARSEFEDWDEPEKKRLMMRLWLDAERDVRPIVREIHIYENEGGRSGIDAVPGRKPAEAKYRVEDLPKGRAAE